MELDERGCGSLHFASGDLPVEDRVPALRGIFNDVVRIGLNTPSDRPISVDLNVHVTPGLRRAQMASNITAHMSRDRQMMSDGRDEVCLILKTGGQLLLRQCGREAEPKLGDAVLLLYREPVELEFRDMTYLAVRIPFAELAGLSVNVATEAARVIAGQSEPISLLRSYLNMLPSRFADTQTSRTTARHVYDLIALALGTGRDMAELARTRGLRALRFDALCTDLERDPRTSLVDLSARHRISPRYVQMLFEEAGTSFTAFVLKRRLSVARTMLVSDRYIGWSVTTIAMEAGFGDLSYFNRSFKKRFGMTPSHLRSESRMLGE